MGDASQDDAAAAAGGAPRREAGDLSSFPGDPGGSDDSSAAGDLIEQIGAEIDRRLDARLAALGLTDAAPTGTAPALPADAAAGATGSRRDADVAPGATPVPRRRTGVARSPWQSLWIGIMIGSAVSGIAAVVAGVGISDWANTHHGGSEPYIYVNAAGEILAGLTVIWALLLVACITHALTSHARDRRRSR